MQSIVLIGNCQIRALYNLYKRFVGDAFRQRLVFIASYEDIAEADRVAIETADVVVEQVLDFKPKADIAGVRTSAERVLVPMVNCGFLWPFAGQPHPNNPSRPYLETGPYGAESSDAFLNRMIKQGVAAEEAVERYLALDVYATVQLDRLHEIVLDKQRKRDEVSGFRIAELIEEHFRDEPVFRTPYHPNARISVALASQFFERLGVARADIEAMQRAIRITPFPKDELPIHPAVVRHFGLRFVPEDRRWQFMHEGGFTTREFYLRYMRCAWNEPLAEGLAWAGEGKLDAARRSLEAGLAQSPGSGPGHGALAYVLTRLGDREGAIAAAERAVSVEPGHAAHHAQLGGLLRTTGDTEAIERELRAAFELDPSEPNFSGLLANFLRDQNRVAQGIAVARRGLEDSPYAPNLYLELGHLLARSGESAAAEASFRYAHERDPKNPAPIIGLAELLEKRGDALGALAALEEALRGDADNVRLLRWFARSLEKADRGEEAEPILRRALVLTLRMSRVTVIWSA